MPPPSDRLAAAERPNSIQQESEAKKSPKFFFFFFITYIALYIEYFFCCAVHLRAVNSMTFLIPVIQSDSLTDYQKIQSYMVDGTQCNLGESDRRRAWNLCGSGTHTHTRAQKEIILFTLLVGFPFPFLCAPRKIVDSAPVIKNDAWRYVRERI